MTRIASILTLVLALAPATRVLAHEGHEHKIMGTVSMVHENHLEVKAADGKTVMLAKEVRLAAVTPAARRQ